MGCMHSVAGASPDAAAFTRRSQKFHCSQGPPWHQVDIPQLGSHEEGPLRRYLLIVAVCRAGVGASGKGARPRAEAERAPRPASCAAVDQCCPQDVGCRAEAESFDAGCLGRPSR